MAHFLNGAAVISRLDGFEFDPDGDRFLSSWKQQGGDVVNLLNAMTPLNSSREGYFEAPKDYFQKHLPYPRASVVYDSVIAAGMGACRALSRDGGENTVKQPPRADLLASEAPIGEKPRIQGHESSVGADKEGPSHLMSPPGPPKDQHIEGILTSSFKGASGAVGFAQRGAHDRVAPGLLFGAFNVRSKLNPDTGLAM